MSVDFSSGLALGWLLKYDEWKHIPRETMEILMEEDYVIFLDEYDAHCDMILTFSDMADMCDAGSATSINRPDVISMDYDNLPGYTVCKKILNNYVFDRVDNPPEWLLYCRIW